MEGSLDEAEARRLRSRLEDEAELRTEWNRLRAMQGTLRTHSASFDEGFSHRVMQRLPAAAGQDESYVEALQWLFFRLEPAALTLILLLAAYNVTAMNEAVAASSFLALAYTFGRGGHIRVSLVLQGLHGRARWWAELWCLTAGTFLAGYLAWFSAKMVWVSYVINDISQGTDATPLWIPQIGMAAGAALFTLALADRLVRVALRRAPADRDADLPLQAE